MPGFSKTQLTSLLLCLAFICLVSGCTAEPVTWDGFWKEVREGLGFVWSIVIVIVFVGGVLYAVATPAARVTWLGVGRNPRNWTLVVLLTILFQLASLAGIVYWFALFGWPDSRETRLVVGTAIGVWLVLYAWLVRLALAKAPGGETVSFPKALSISVATGACTLLVFGLLNAIIPPDS
ncbi:MAG: hypothetical protein AB1646_13075 [Thermodesulfobacteriota bacterium]